MENADKRHALNCNRPDNKYFHSVVTRNVQFVKTFFTNTSQVPLRCFISRDLVNGSKHWLVTNLVRIGYEVMAF